jgi:glycine/D-amino acid oxidase-like deaminating enzyme
MWARQLGAKAGVNIPLQSAEHYYLITDKIAGLADSARARGPGSFGYFREEVGGLMVGLFEPVCAPWKVGGARGLLVRRDHPRLGPHGAVRRDGDEARPHLARDGRAKFFCGPESFTPDLQPVVGESPELKNYFVAAGLNSIGILTGGGLGRVLAHWIMTGARRRRHRGSTSIASTPTRRTPSTAARARSSRWGWSTSATTRRAPC